MPILKREQDTYPENLLENPAILGDPDRVWWCIYTMSRREKDLMRRFKLNDNQFPSFL